MNTRYLILTLLTILITTALLQAETTIDYYPHTIVAEYTVSSEEQENTRAYRGINHLTGIYNSRTLIPIRYYHSEVDENYSSAAVDSFLEQRIHMIPASLFVNKTTLISDANLPIDTGKPYQYAVEKEYYQASPLKMEISSFDNNTGEVEAAMTLLSKTKVLEEAVVRFVLIENDVADGVTNVARDVKELPASLTEPEAEVRLQTIFELDESYNRENLQAAAYIVHGGTMIQAASTYDNYPPHIRAAFPQKRIETGPAEGVFEADYFAIYLFGSAADLTFEAVIDEAPQGWSLTFCDDEGSCYFGPKNFKLDEEEAAAFHSNVMPQSPGMMDYHFKITSPHLDTYIIPARYITDDVDVLLVDGDGWESYEKYVESALAESNYSYGTWCTTMADLGDEINYHNIVWITGEREPALSAAETNYLRDHLDNGNNLLISGQNIGKYLAENDFYRDTEFFNKYLNAALQGTDSESFTLNGVPDDPVSDGLMLSLNEGDSADNQVSPDFISVNNENLGSVIFSYPNRRNGALRTINRHGRGAVVYLAFGYEGIDNPDDRQQLLNNTLNWFKTTNIDKDELTPATSPKLKLLQSHPNPFSSLKDNSTRSQGISIPYYLPQGSGDEASLTIYNIRGQVVKHFDGIESSDNQYNYLNWDGKDTNGNQSPTGIYFYILRRGTEKAIRKLSIIR